MTNDVFPRPNLPPASTPWGRRVTEAIRLQERSIEDLGLSQSGLNRASAGQLGVVGRQIEALGLQQDEIIANVTELESRSTHLATPASLAVTGSAVVTPFPSGLREIDFPAPVGGRRSAVLSFSWDYSNSGSSTVSAYAEIIQGSNVIWRSPSGQSVPWGASAPAGWVPGASGVAAVQVPSPGSTFYLRLHRVGFQAITTTLTAFNIRAVLQYGDRY